MYVFEQYQAPPSWLTILGEEKVVVPEWLTIEVRKLKLELRQILLADYEHLGSALEKLLPKVWELRMIALPLLSKLDLSEVLKKLEFEFALIPQRLPSLAAAAEKLNFGLQLMGQWVKEIISQHPDLLHNLKHELPNSVSPSFDEIAKQIDQDNNHTLKNLLHGSLMMEVLLFAVDLAADEQLPLDFGICYEISYQSAIAVEEYASAIELQAERMPWYSPPHNDLERLLLSGPILAEPEIQYILEKREHLNLWK